jgi:hypothetical protein
MVLCCFCVLLCDWTRAAEGRLQSREALVHGASRLAGNRHRSGSWARPVGLSGSLTSQLIGHTPQGGGVPDRACPIVLDCVPTGERDRLMRPVGAGEGVLCGPSERPDQRGVCSPGQCRAPVTAGAAVASQRRRPRSHARISTRGPCLAREPLGSLRARLPVGCRSAGCECACRWLRRSHCRGQERRAEAAVRRHRSRECSSRPERCVRAR